IDPWRKNYDFALGSGASGSLRRGLTRHQDQVCLFDATEMRVPPSGFGRVTSPFLRKRGDFVDQPIAELLSTFCRHQALQGSSNVNDIVGLRLELARYRPCETRPLRLFRSGDANSEHVDMATLLKMRQEIRFYGDHVDIPLE